jgi:hypothetical protein
LRAAAQFVISAGCPQTQQDTRGAEAMSRDCCRPRPQFRREQRNSTDDEAEVTRRLAFWLTSLRMLERYGCMRDAELKRAVRIVSNISASWRSHRRSHDNCVGVE